MNKYFLFSGCLIVLLSSCSNAIKDSTDKTKEEPLQDISKSAIIATPPLITKNLSILTRDDLYGFWVGMFEPDNGNTDNEPPDDPVLAGERIVWDKSNKISVSIDSIAEDSTVFGHSVVAGNLRPFSGKYNFISSENMFEFKVREPGDDKYDGSFSFSITMNGNSISGTWQSYKPLDIPKRKYTLSKTLFVYDPGNKLENVYIDWEKSRKRKTNPEEDDYYDKEYFATSEKIDDINPSGTLLTSKDVENLTKADIYILRNSIYAKHGFSFKKRALRAYFDAHAWYMPVHVDIRKDLTEIEKANIKLLLRYEQHAEEYYDEFGRG